MPSSVGVVLKRSRRTNVVEVHDTVPSDEFTRTEQLSPVLNSPMSPQSPQQSLMRPADYLSIAAQKCDFRRMVNQHVQHAKSQDSLPGEKAFQDTPPLCAMLYEVKVHLASGDSEPKRISPHLRISQASKDTAMLSWFPSLEPYASGKQSWWQTHHKQAWAFIKNSIRSSTRENTARHDIFTKQCHCPHVTSYPTITFSCDFENGGIHHVKRNGTNESTGSSNDVFDVKRNKILRLNTYHLSFCDTFILWVAMQYHKHLSAHPVNMAIANVMPSPVQEAQLQLHDRIDNLRSDNKSLIQRHDNAENEIKSLKLQLKGATEDKQHLKADKNNQDEIIDETKQKMLLLEEEKLNNEKNHEKALGALQKLLEKTKAANEKLETQNNKLTRMRREVSKLKT